MNRDVYYVFLIYIAWPWRHGWSLLCCNNVVGLVFGDRWPAIIFILCFVYFDHNGGGASSASDKKPSSIRLVLFLWTCIRLLSTGENRSFHQLKEWNNLKFQKKREEKAHLHRGTQEEGGWIGFRIDGFGLEKRTDCGFAICAVNHSGSWISCNFWRGFRIVPS